MIQKNLLALFFNNITNYFYTEKLALSIGKKGNFQLLITNHYDKKNVVVNVCTAGRHLHLEKI